MWANSVLGILHPNLIYLRDPQNPVNNHSQQMVHGLLGLLKLCPQEVAHLRKELLIAARHILSTELRNST